MKDEQIITWQIISIQIFTLHHRISFPQIRKLQKIKQMGMDMTSTREWFRLILAMAIAPSIPILALAMTMWHGSGSANWFPFVFLFGYLFFFLFGLPVIGVLLKKRTLPSCALGGGSVTIAPILLLSLFSISSTNHPFGGNMLFDLALLFMAGVIGGVAFWCIAFAGTKAANTHI